ncbi:MAG: hypothetical protein IPK32_13280 [Verrucomicrobiaceae bacterium]|nr:hypothetical protein [Verrucomicrobiaceae bacterium]
MKASFFIALLLTTPMPAADLDFYRDVYPFLKTNCISCHNKTTTKADLNMETPELMIRGGESGASIVPGKSAESLVVAASLHTQDMEMPPPNNKSGAVNLTPAEIAILRQWIDQGAKSSRQEQRNVVLKSISASVDPIYSIAISPDGRFAACGRSNDIFIYDLATRTLAMRLDDAHRALVHSLAFSPDGARLASGSFREVKLWRMQPAKAANPAIPSPAPKSADAALLQKISAAAKITILSHALSADAKTALIGCSDGSVRLFDIGSMKLLRELRGSMATQEQIATLERTIAVQTLEQAFQKSEITRIEAQDKALDVLLGKAKDAITAMQKVLPEKQKLVKPSSDALSAAQKVVDDLSAKLAAAKDTTVEKDLKAAQDKLITAKMSETSALAAVSAAESNVKDAEDDLKRITASKAQNAKAIQAATAAISSAKAAQDKASAVLTALKQPATAKTILKATAVSFSAEAGKAAALFEDGTLRVWGTATGKIIAESRTATPTTTLAPNTDGSFAATQAVSIRTAAAPQWSLERTLDEKGLFADRVNAVCFSPDGKTLATGSGELSRSGDIAFFDLVTGKVTRTWKEKHSDSVLCIDFSPDGRHLASGAADKTVKVTEIASGKQVHLFEGHTHHITSVCYRSDGRVLASAGADGVVSTWDLIIGERKKKIEGWTKEVTSLRYMGATNQIVTSSGDNKIRIITDDGGDIRSIADLPDFMQAATSTPDGATLLAGGEDSILRLWDSSNGKELITFGK